MPGTERLPEGWPGWPEGKQFALLLTHDVEGPGGLEKCRQLMQLEKRLGFRSSFNFIPEGDYQVSPELREELRQHGFEVGVHDLEHDGKLYRGRQDFARKAERINRHLKEWGAVGFRSGFMLRNLDWLHDLNIQYDTSTFDTDPFEPQSEGCNTIFPFWVRHSESGHTAGAAGYVELPYTLPQDSTLFLIFREKTMEIWCRKLEWIARHGGMALVNVHPDYASFSGERSSREKYSIDIYESWLRHVAEKYSGKYWNPCPAELATWYAKQYPLNTGRVAAGSPIYATSDVLRGRRAAVILFSYYPADPRPRRAAEAMVEAGMAVDLFCLSESTSDPAEETVGGVRIFRHPLQRHRGSKGDYLWQYGRFLLAAFWFLSRRSLGRGYDVVHIHNMPDILAFAALIPKLRGAGIILDLHDPMPELMMSIYGLESNHWMVRLLRCLERWSIGFADLVLTPNLAFKTLFISRSCGAEKIQIVMNSPQPTIFDPDRFGPDAVRQDAPGAFRIMHHGSIVSRHGVDLLVQAVARLRATIPEVQLDIYGSRTPFLDTVLDLARRLGVADIVHYHGAKAQSEIAQAIRSCHVGVVPNRRSPFTEINFPTRLFEYLALHRPVIAPATQGIRDYFSPEQLLMFEPDNLDDLVAKILWVRSHPGAVPDLVARGLHVYRENLWQGEQARFLKHVAALVSAD